MINENFVYLGALLGLVGTVSYSCEMFKGQVKPNRVTWFLWALAPLIAFSVMVKQGVGISSLMTFIAGFGPLIIFTLSFAIKKSYWEITRLDIICGILSIVALILWALTRVGNIAILLSVIADALAATPTIIKSWHEPETEDYRAYLASTLGALVTILTLKSWGFDDCTYPIYVFTVCLIITILVRFPKLRSRVS